MGQAYSTTKVVIPGLRLFNAYQKKNFEPFLEDMTEEYVEEDNIKFLLTDYSNWIATTAIPKYFNEDLKSNITIFINESPLKNDINKVILMLKYNFPKLCSWEEPEWTTRMNGEEFENKCKCEQGRWDVKVFEETKRGL